MSPQNEMTTEFIIDSEGRKRKAVKSCCLNCNNLFLYRVYKGKKPATFCSWTCCQSFRQFKKSLGFEIQCSMCNKLFFRKKLKPSKSNLYFCSRMCKDLAQQKKQNFKEMWPDHYIEDTINQNYIKIPFAERKRA